MLRRVHFASGETKPGFDRPGGRMGLLLRLALAIGLGITVAGSAIGDEHEAAPAEIEYETADQIPLLNPQYRKSAHKVVLITDEALSPRLVTLEEEQLVAWISYAKAPSTVEFERDVAKSMICHSLVNFSIQDGALRSAEIRTGEFASFCQLKPGRYRYRVTRTNPTGSDSTTSPRRLDGEIIVGNP